MSVSDESQRPQKVTFNGIFTQEIRNLIVARRYELGIARMELAQFLDVDESTVQKWENGKVKKCSMRCVRKLRDFINGYGDLNFSDNNSNHNQTQNNKQNAEKDKREKQLEKLLSRILERIQKCAHEKLTLERLCQIILLEIQCLIYLDLSEDEENELE